MRNVAPDRTERISDDEVAVPVERFLARRMWLGQLLQDHRCAFLPDAQVSALLAKAVGERDEVAEALRAGVTPVPEEEVQSLLKTAGFVRDLKTFQVRDLAHLLALSNGANFSVPGAGKTSVAYALYACERQRGRVERMVVVAPLSAFDAWFTEAEECLAPPPRVARLVSRPPRCEVMLVNYQRLASRYDELLEVDNREAVPRTPRRGSPDEAGSLRRVGVGLS